MKFGSVCSGIEAASVAWPFWKAAWFSEIEPFPCAVLKHHYPEVPNHGDMTALPDRILSGEVEAPDVFCGGTPCQAFSVAGNRKSLDDARGNLSLTFCEIADAIDAVRYVRNAEPAIIFWENVPGVLNTPDNAFGCFLGKLAGEHCELQPPGGRWTDAGVVHGPKRAIAWRVLDAQYFGLAQRRKRVFVVASSRDGFDPCAVLFELDGVRRDTAPSRQARQGIAADAESGIKWPADVASTLNVEGAGGNQRMPDKGNLGAVVVPVCAEISPTVTYGIPGNWIGRAPENGGNATTPMDNVAPCLTSADRHGVATIAPPHAFKIRGGCEGGGKGYLGQDEQAFTITTGHDQQVAVALPFGTDCYNGSITGNIAATMGTPGTSVNASGPTVAVPQYIGAIDYEFNAHSMEQPTGPLLKGSPTGGGHPLPAIATQYAVRRLTPVECERLQGFPDNYTNIPWRNKPEAPDGPRYKALGNSWAVPVVNWIGQRIQKSIEETK